MKIHFSVRDLLENRTKLAVTKLILSSMFDYFVVRLERIFCSYDFTSDLSLIVHSKKSDLGFPTRKIPLKKFLNKLNIAPTDTLVDYGAGKGRAIITFIQHGLKKAKAIEIDSNVVTTLKKNISQTQKNYDFSIEIINKNVTDYIISNEDNLFYFYEAFEKETLTICLLNIKNSFLSHPRKVRVIYHNNIYHEDYINYIASHLGPYISRDEFCGNRFFLFCLE